MSLKIIPFKPEYSNSFRDLNLAWLERYFYVEPKDHLLLENCEEHIIDKGGFIFLAQYNEVIVGCFSLIRVDGKSFELGKMAVDTGFQGLKIGQKLVSFAIEFARKKGWHRLVLYSNTKLYTALHIYRKHGFREVPLEDKLPYLRSDIKMELILSGVMP